MAGICFIFRECMSKRIKDMRKASGWRKWSFVAMHFRTQDTTRLARSLIMLFDVHISMAIMENGWPYFGCQNLDLISAGICRLT